MGYGSVKTDIYGCTDSAASNYNSAATVDDGGCEYGGDDKDSSTITTKTTDPKTGKTTTTIKTTDTKIGKTTSTTKTTNPKTGKTTTTIKTTYSGNEEGLGQDKGKEKDTEEDPKFSSETTLVVEVGMEATLQDGWYLAKPETDYLFPDLNNPYAGPYHLMEDGTYMKGVGTEGVSHTIHPKDVIIQDSSHTYQILDPDLEDDDIDPVSHEFMFVPENIQRVREIVSDLFYKKWFVEHTLTDEDVLSLQTTIRDGKKQTAGKDGRAEGEPLVFYKKDRNTLENREDLQGDYFELICTDILDNEIPQGEIPDLFQIFEPPEAAYDNTEEPTLEPNFHWKLQKYIMRYTNVPASYDIVIAEKVILYEDVTYPPDDTDTGEGG
jgi:hypothetical protein